MNLNNQLRLFSNKATYKCSATLTTAVEASLQKKTVVLCFFDTIQWCSGFNILRLQTKSNPDKQLFLFWRSKRTSPNERVAITWLMLWNQGYNFGEYSLQVNGDLFIFLSISCPWRESFHTASVSSIRPDFTSLHLSTVQEKHLSCCVSAITSTFSLP